MSYSGTETCKVCGGKSFFYTEFKELLIEIHCLNEDCGFFKVESGKHENWNKTDFRTPDEVKEFLDDMELKKCGRCGDVDDDDNEGSPFCEDCETEEEYEKRHDLVK